MLGSGSGGASDDVSLATSRSAKVSVCLGFDFDIPVIFRSESIFCYLQPNPIFLSGDCEKSRA